MRARKREMHKGLFLMAVFLAGWSAGCATISGRSQVVSFDTKPRGVTLSVEEHGVDTVLGTSPFIAQVPRQSTLSLTARDIAGQEMSQKVACDFRWGASLLGNAPLALVVPNGLGIGLAVGILIDIVSGAAYDCPESITLTAAGMKPKSLEKECQTLLLLPPPHFDEKFSDYLLGRWELEFKKQTSPCLEVVDSVGAKAFLSKYDISALSSYRIHQMPRRVINEAGLKTGADRIVAISFPGGKRALSQADVYDIHSLSRLERKQLSLTASELAQFPLQSTGKVLVQSISFLPNSVSFGSYVDKLGDYGDELQDRRSLPAVIANWSLVNVDHPYQYGAWAFNLKLAPSLATSLVSKRLVRPSETANTSEANSSQPKAYKFNLFSLSSLFKAIPTFHTPLGALSIGIGLGTSFLYFGDNEPYRVQRLSLVSSVDVAYTFFVSENFFLRVSTAQQRLLGTKIQTADVAIKDWQTTGISLGYFFPEMRTMVRNLF